MTVLREAGCGRLPNHHSAYYRSQNEFNPLKEELNPICHLLALLGAHLIFHVSRIRVKMHRLFILYFISDQKFSYLTL